MLSRNQDMVSQKDINALVVTMDRLSDEFHTSTTPKKSRAPTLPSLKPRTLTRSQIQLPSISTTTTLIVDLEEHLAKVICTLGLIICREIEGRENESTKNNIKHAMKRIVFNNLQYNIFIYPNLTPIEGIKQYIISAKNDKDHPYNNFINKVNKGIQKLSEEFDRTSSHLLINMRSAYQHMFNIYTSRNPLEHPIGNIYLNIYHKYLLDSDTQNDEMRVLRAITRGSGVILMKIFQKFAGFDNVDPSIRNILRQCYENNPKITDAEFIKVKSLLYNSSMMNDNSFTNNPIAVASVGQVHKVKMNDGTEAIFKFVKPNALAFTYYEFELLKEVTSEIGKYCLNMFSELAKEFSYNLENKNIEIGNTIYSSPQDKLYTISSIPYTFPPEHFITPLPGIVMSMAKGVSLKSVITNSDKGTCIQIIDIYRKLIMKWIFNALVKSPGYAHLDLHPGNIMVTGGKSPSITIIDFGNFISVSRTIQCNILNILLQHRKLIDLVKMNKPIKESIFKSIASKILIEFTGMCKLDKSVITTSLINKLVIFFKSDNYSRIKFLFDIIGENITTFGICTENEVFEFTKGIGMIESTWEQLCECSVEPNISFMQIAMEEFKKTSPRTKLGMLMKIASC